jgi:hypothetical protein
MEGTSGPDLAAHLSSLDLLSSFDWGFDRFWEKRGWSFGPFCC